MVLKKNKALIIMIMAVMIFLRVDLYESFATGSVSTSISGGGTYEQGDKVTVRFSFTGPEEGRLAGVVSQLSFNPEVLRFESMRGASNTTVLAPGVYEGITIHDLQNTESINNNGGFTSGIYNDSGVTTLGASVTFEVIRPGEATVTVRSTHAGTVSFERLGNTSAGTTISATESKDSEESDDTEEGGSGGGSNDTESDSGSDSSSEENSGSEDSDGTRDESSETNSLQDEGNETSSGSDKKGDSEGENSDDNGAADGEPQSNKDESSTEALHSTGSSAYFEKLAAMDVREEGWFVLNDLSNIEHEDGFEIREIEYEDERVHSAFHEGKNITLLYFTDVTGEEIRRYIYSEESDELYPYVTITQGLLYTFLPGIPESGLPKAYEETQLVVDGQVLRAWQHQDKMKADFYLVHAVNELGESGWYQYDQQERTMQRFVLEEEETGTEEESEEDGFFAVLQQSRMMQGTFISLSILTLVMAGAAGVLGYKLSSEKKKKSKRTAKKQD